MEVTALTRVVAIAGLVLIGLLGSLLAVALVSPWAEWTIENVCGGHPEAMDPEAYFALTLGV